MYRCGVCQGQSGPGESRRVHQVTRLVPCVRVTQDGLRPSMRSEIAREVSVCGKCDKALREGYPMEKLVREAEALRTMQVVEVKAPEAPKPKVLPVEKVTGNVVKEVPVKKPRIKKEEDTKRHLESSRKPKTKKARKLLARDDNSKKANRA